MVIPTNDAERLPSRKAERMFCELFEQIRSSSASYTFAYHDRRYGETRAAPGNKCVLRGAVPAGCLHHSSCALNLRGIIFSISWNAIAIEKAFYSFTSLSHSTKLFTFLFTKSCRVLLWHLTRRVGILVADTWIGV